MVDEPTEGLAPMMVDRVRELLEAVAARGTTILLVEQKLAIALAISSRLYVMGHGRVVFEGTPAALAADAWCAPRMVGGLTDMGSINAVVDLQLDGDVAVIVMDNPPVNALGIVVREGLMQAFEPACTRMPRREGGGADRHGARVLRRRRHHRVRQAAEDADPLGEVIAMIEAFDRPCGGLRSRAWRWAAGWNWLSAAITGWRCTGAKLGLPEVKLGICCPAPAAPSACRG